MFNLKKAAATAALVIGAGAVSLTAFAAPAYKTPAEAAAGVTGSSASTVAQQRAGGKTYGTIAKDAGKLEEFKTQMLQIKKDILAKRVADGKITQAEADKIYAEIEKAVANCDGTAHGTHMGQKYGVGFGYGDRTGRGQGQMQGQGHHYEPQAGRPGGSGYGHGLHDGTGPQHDTVTSKPAN